MVRHLSSPVHQTAGKAKSYHFLRTLKLSAYSLQQHLGSDRIGKTGLPVLHQPPNRIEIARQVERLGDWTLLLAARFRGCILRDRRPKICVHSSATDLKRAVDTVQRMAAERFDGPCVDNLVHGCFRWPNLA